MANRRTLQGISGALLLALSVAGFFAGTASAASKEIDPTKQAWYWRSSFKANVEGTGLNAQPPSPHAESHFPVAVLGGKPDKMTFLQWDVSFFVGGSVSRFAFTAPVSVTTDPAHVQEHLEGQSPPPQTLRSDAAAIRVCPVKSGEFIVNGAKGEPSTVNTVNEEGEAVEVRQEPEFDCNLAAVTMTPSEDRASWTADIAPIAKLWADESLPNNGVALVPVIPASPDPRHTWQVEFHGADLGGFTAQVEYTPPEPTAGAAPFTSDFGAPQPVFGPQQPTFSPGTPGGSFVEEIPPQAGTRPSQTIVGGEQTGRGAGAGTLPWYVWFLAPVGATGLYLMSRALRPEWAAAAGGAENRIASLLRARRLGAAA